MRGRVSIVGIGEAGMGAAPDRTFLQITAEAALTALADAGLTPRDVDGVLCARSGNLTGADMPSVEIAEYLGIAPRYTDSTLAGGASALIHVEHAAAAIMAGLCRVCLIVYGSTQKTRQVRKIQGYRVDPESPDAQYERPYENLSPIGNAALLARRHMYEYGTRPEDLAAVAVAARRWAALTPGAGRPQPLTVAEVLASPLVADPLRVTDICMVTDGAGAVVVMDSQAARSHRSPVPVLGTGSLHRHHIFSQGRCATTTAAVTTGQAAFAMAGLTPADVDVLQIYDAFTILPILALEDLGFCPKGQGGAVFREGRTAPGGDLPMNTQGGGLAYAHPGMFGTFLITEAVRQLRGEAGGRQQTGVRVALCHGIGGPGISTHATLILGSP